MPAPRKVSEEQMLTLIDYMEKHPNFANFGQGSTKYSGAIGTRQITEQWNELTKILNSVGNGNFTKEATKWRQYWCEVKSHTRRKAAIIQSHYLQFPNEPLPTRRQLTEREERIIALAGIVTRNIDISPVMACYEKDPIDPCDVNRYAFSNNCSVDIPVYDDTNSTYDNDSSGEASRVSLEDDIKMEIKIEDEDADADQNRHRNEYHLQQKTEDTTTASVEPNEVPRTSRVRKRRQRYTPGPPQWFIRFERQRLRTEEKRLQTEKRRLQTERRKETLLTRIALALEQLVGRGSDRNCEVKSNCELHLR